MFQFEESVAILTRTPQMLNALLSGLPDTWTMTNEGGDTWSPYHVLGHLVHGERTDWIPRVKRILARDGQPFDPFDPFAQFEASKGKSMRDLLETFTQLRAENLTTLKGFNLQAADFALPGKHPALGDVTLAQLIACWTVHDLDHTRQIIQVMARQYTTEVGPWRAYLSILS